METKVLSWDLMKSNLFFSCKKKTISRSFCTQRCTQPKKIIHVPFLQRAKTSRSSPLPSTSSSKRVKFSKSDVGRNASLMNTKSFLTACWLHLCLGASTGADDDQAGSEQRIEGEWRQATESDRNCWTAGQWSRLWKLPPKPRGQWKSGCLCFACLWKCLFI